MIIMGSPDHTTWDTITRCPCGDLASLPEDTEFYTTGTACHNAMVHAAAGV